MRKASKRVWPLLVALGLVIAAVSMAGLPAAAAADPMEIKILRGYSGYTVGDNAAGGTNVNVGGSGETAVISQTFGGLGAVNSLTLSAAGEVAGLASNYELKYPDYPSLAGLEGIMVYVKLPRDGEQMFSRLFFNFVVEAGGGYQYINWGAWSKGNNHVSFLSKDSSRWEDTATDDSGNITLSYGFEGYVRFLFSDLNQATRDALALPDAKAIDSTVKFRMVGGKHGVGKVGAVYGITKNSDSLMAALDGAEAKGLTTGKPLDPDNQPFLDASMKAAVIQDFNAFEAGENIGNSRAYAIANNGGFTFSTTASAKIGGFDSTPALKLSGSEAKGWFNGHDFYYEVFNSADMKMDDMKAILMYVKLAPPVLEELESKMFFSLYSSGPSGPKWTNPGGGKALYMPKGGNKWFSINASEGILTLPGSFEGYVMMDISELRGNPIADLLTDRTLISTTFRLHSVGGDGGDCYIQSLYAVTDKGTDNAFITLNGQDVYCLKTHELAVQEDFKPKPPEIDEEFSDLPVPTSAKTVYDLDASYIDADSARAAWEVTDTAEAYRVDVFSFNTLTERYICASTEETDENRVILVDLREDTTYYVVVNALDSKEQIMGIYEPKRFRTGVSEMEFSWGDDEETGGWGEFGEGIGNHETSDNSPVGMVIVITAAAALTAVLCKKKKAGEEL